MFIVKGTATYFKSAASPCHWSLITSKFHLELKHAHCDCINFCGIVIFSSNYKLTPIILYRNEAMFGSYSSHGK